MSQNIKKIIVIGGSAGGLEALLLFLPQLPESFPYPIYIVMHIPPDRESILPEVLNEKCHVKVLEAQDKEDALPGCVYLAPPNYHLLVEKDGSISLSSEEPVLFSRPSIDVLFETAAYAFGANVIAFLLSGANEDGSKGMKIILEKGGAAYIQDPSTAQAKMMPEESIKQNPTAIVVNPAEISEVFKGVK